MLANLTCAGKHALLTARLESTQQFRFLRGKLGLAQNASSMQPGQTLYRAKYLVMAARRSARGSLLRGRLKPGFGRRLRSILAGDRRQTAYINAAELARETEGA